MMSSPEYDRQVTDSFISNVMSLLRGVLDSQDPRRRAERVGEAQRQLSWGTRRQVDEARNAGRSWREISGDLAIGHDALFRQYNAGGPIVVANPFHSRDSRNVPSVAQLAIAFRTTDDGELHVLPEQEVHELASFMLTFRPVGPSPYKGRELQFYFQPEPDLLVTDLGRAAGYPLRPEGLGVIVSITEQVMDELFGPPIIGSPERNEWEVKLHARNG